MHTPLYKATQPLNVNRRRWLIVGLVGLVSLAFAATILGTGFSRVLQGNPENDLGANGPGNSNRASLSNIINSTTSTPSATPVPTTPTAAVTAEPSATPIPPNAVATVTMTSLPTDTTGPQTTGASTGADLSGSNTPAQSNAGAVIGATSTRVPAQSNTGAAVAATVTPTPAEGKANPVAAPPGEAAPAPALVPTRFGRSSTTVPSCL